MLGMTLAYGDNFAAVFNIGGVTVRVSNGVSFSIYPSTWLGLNTPMGICSAWRTLEKHTSLAAHGRE
jgi:hypothetical protein